MPERLPQYVSEAFLPHPPEAMGVAVSGGSDSMALLYLLKEFCDIHSITLRAVTVDHNLRSEAADEAERVARQCRKLGVPHDTLVWQDWNGEGNLQSAARDARYSKIADWAGTYGIDTIAVGHTADDQAETVLMRLARRSGVDGLSAMHARTLRKGINWVRPLLKTRRAVLRRYLEDRDVSWIDDPSNDDDRYDRIKARKALQHLAPLGIDAEALVEIADHMAQARKALDWHTFLAAKQVVSTEAGALVLDETGLRLQPDEVQRRLMAKSISWVSGAEYAPRRAPLAAVMAGLNRGQAGTLGGCHIRRIAARIWIFREHKAVSATTCATDELWDNRWRMTPYHPATHHEDLRIRPLGMEGLNQCPDWKSSGRPHLMLQSTPAIWRWDKLVAAPLAGYAQNWHADLHEPPDTFFAALLSH